MITRSQRVARWTEQLAKCEAELAILDDTYATIAAKDYESYKFDSGVGSQQTKIQDLEKVGKQQRIKQSRIDYLINKINGTGLVRMKLNRRGC